MRSFASSAIHDPTTWRSDQWRMLTRHLPRPRLVLSQEIRRSIHLLHKKGFNAGRAA